MDSHKSQAVKIAETSAQSETPTSPEFEPERDVLSGKATWQIYTNQLIAAEVSAVSRYCDSIVQLNPRGGDNGLLLSLIDCPNRGRVRNEDTLPDFRLSKISRDVVLLNGNLNHDLDFQGTLARIKPKLSRHSRVVLVAYNPYYRWLYWAANRLGIRKGEEPTTFVTATDLENLATLSGFEVVSMRCVAAVPWKLWGIGDLLNRLIPALPLVKNLCLATVIVLRPRVLENSRPSLSIVIPARNERGNIEGALQRLTQLAGENTEVIFVEGHSSDGTWEEIQRVLPEYSHKFKLQAFQQTGKGKSDAVRLGFSKATGELLTILDADLTMPPELLHRFYDAYCEGLADFINGNRLTYPMEGEAMRFLNRLGNVFFAKALSAVLGMRLGDSLCGTKLLTKRDYDRMCQWRSDFGDFDPFGDFELLFPAAILGLGIVDIPIRYRDRVYGSTNIRRFYHGLMLLKMTLIGLLRIRMGRISTQNSPL